MSLASNAAKKLGFSKMLSYGLNAYFAYDSFKSAREEGASVPGALASAAIDIAGPMLIGGWTYLGLQLAASAPAMAVSAVDSLGQMARENTRQRRQGPFSQNMFIDNENIATMRQAGMALAKRSKYALQQAMLGNEAQYLHK